MVVAPEVLLRAQCDQLFHRGIDGADLLFQWQAFGDAELLQVQDIALAIWPALGKCEDHGSASHFQHFGRQGHGVSGFAEEISPDTFAVLRHLVRQQTNRAIAFQYFK